MSVTLVIHVNVYKALLYICLPLSQVANSISCCRNAKTMAPVKFWELFGYITPSLKRLALKVLSVAVTTCASERNW